MRIKLAALFGALMLALAACASDEAAAFGVTDVWARSTPNGLGAVYATFTTDADDELVSAEVNPDVASRVELHEVVNDDGVMRMQQVGSIPVTTAEGRMLRPGDYHVMLLDLPQMLAEGDTFDVTFVFASGRTLTAPAEVRLIEDDTMSHGDMHDHDEQSESHQG